MKFLRRQFKISNFNISTLNFKKAMEEQKNVNTSQVALALVSQNFKKATKAYNSRVNQQV
jgi:hypothetical protein